MFPQLLQSKLIHAVTHWPQSSGEYGGVSYGAAKTFSGRWRDVAELFVNSRGKEEVSKARVVIDPDFTPEVKVGDYLFFGDSTGVAADPRNQTNAHQIRTVRKTADLTGNVYLTIAIL